MKKLLFVALFLGLAMPSLAYDITFDNNVVKIKKSAITMVYVQDGDLYDSYTSKYRDQGKITFRFVPGAGDPNGWKLLTAFKNLYKAPSGEEGIVYDGEYLSIPFSAWESNNTIQIEPNNLFAIHGLVDDILPLKASGITYTGWLIKHYFDYWHYSN